MSTTDRDEMSGAETTGHEWDGIKELNLPAPRWWLIVFLLTVIWGVGYMVVYPAWPTLSGEGNRGGTPGTAGWSSYSELSDSQQEIMTRRAAYLADFREASYDDILADPGLFEFARAGGGAAFKDNCATCHGTGGAGAPGYPNLNDDAWIWGGTHADIEASIAYGIRSAHGETRVSQMPAFGDLLSAEEISAVTGHVLSLGGGDSSTPLGAQIFSEQCALCHGEAGHGNRDLGAPNLADAIWLYGGTAGEISTQIRSPRHGQMPAWSGRLDADTIRQLTIFVHSLGGGEGAEDSGGSAR